MHAQMRAERDRRATVTEAQGYREAAIARADGEKQSSILAAEGRKAGCRSSTPRVTPRRSSCAPPPNSIRLERFGAGRGRGRPVSACTGIKSAEADQTVLTVEYLTALTRIGDGRATKLVIPAEFSGLLGMLAALVETTPPSMPTTDEVRPQGGLPVPVATERVDLPETGGRR